MRELVQKDVSVPQLKIAARMIQRVDGGPMRTAADISQKRVSGWYKSLKNGKARFHESANEKKAFMISEMRTDIKAYHSQPLTFEMVIDGKKRSYTPDRMDIFADDRVEIVEVKGGYKAESKPDYHSKLEIVKLICENSGWSFRIQDVHDLEETPEFHVLKYMQTFRRTAVTPHEEDLVLAVLEADGSAPLSRVRALWSNPVLGFAKLCALMVKRTIHIDVAGGLSDDTLVSLVKG